MLASLEREPKPQSRHPSQRGQPLHCIPLVLEASFQTQAAVLEGIPKSTKPSGETRSLLPFYLECLASEDTCPSPESHLTEEKKQEF